MTATRTLVRTGIVGAVIGAPIIAAAAPALAAPLPNVDGNGNLTAPARTQISLNGPVGFHVGTANEHEARPGLSIVKLYIADYVYKHGAPEDQAKATRMIQHSDDAIASELYAKYPNSINATASAYGLENTNGAAHWGNSTTSSYDTAKFLAAKQQENPADPVLAAMQTASPVAADGYAQDYGTATLPGVTGSKWGWSDDRTSYHGSASIGPGFSIAANTNGTKEQHTQDVQGAFNGSGTLGNQDAIPAPDQAPALPQIPGLPPLPDSPSLPDLSGSMDFSGVNDVLNQIGLPQF